MIKKIKNVNWYNISMCLASALLILGSLFLIIWKTMNDTIAIAVLMGAMIIMTGFLQYLGMEDPSKDERVRKIGTRATTYSWYITIIFVSFLLISSYWTGRERSGTEMLSITILVMITTMISINTYLNWKGDVE